MFKNKKILISSLVFIILVGILIYMVFFRVRPGKEVPMDEYTKFQNMSMKEKPLLARASCIDLVTLLRWRAVQRAT